MKTFDKAHDEGFQDDATIAMPGAPETRQRWVKPEIASFKPVTAARGISYTPNDGISNLTL